MAAVPAFALLALVFWSFGDVLSRLLRLRIEPGPVKFALSAALTYGFLTLLVFCLAVFRAVSGAACGILVALMLLVSVRELKMNLGALATGIRLPGWSGLLRPREWQSWAVWLSGLVLLLAFVQALAPATGMDTGRMHFAAVKIMLRAHGLSPEPEPWFHRTGGFYMIYLFGMSLQGEALAKLLAFGAALLSLLLAAAASDLLRPGTGRSAAAVIALTPLFTGYAGHEYLELPVMMYLLASLLAFLKYARGEGPGWLVAAGALIGFSAGVKVTAFPVLVLVPALAGTAIRRAGRRCWPGLLGAAGLCLLAVGFWPAWNRLTVGSWFFNYLDPLPDSYPFARTGERWISGIFFALGSQVTSSGYLIDSPGPFIVACLAGILLFRGPRESRLPALLLAGSVVFYLGVLVLRLRDYLWVDAHARYLGPCFLGMGALAAGPFLGWSQSGPRWLGRALVAALLLPALPLLMIKAGKAAVAAPAAFGFESRSQYLGKKIETFAACEILNGLPDPDVKVLFMAQRPYYLDRPLAPSRFWEGVRNREDLVRRVRELQITHVLFEPETVYVEWLRDPDPLFGSRPFRELGRWPWKQKGFVRLYAVEPP